MPEDQERRRGIGGIGEGIRSGIAVVGAFMEAIEDTIQEAVDRGDLSPERARQTVRDATRRFQDGIGEARERFDLVSRQEVDDLRRELMELRRRIDQLEGRTPNLLARPDEAAEPPEENAIPLDER